MLTPANLPLRGPEILYYDFNAVSFFVFFKILHHVGYFFSYVKNMAVCLLISFGTTMIAKFYFYAFQIQAAICQRCLPRH